VPLGATALPAAETLEPDAVSAPVEDVVLATAATAAQPAAGALDTLDAELANDAWIPPTPAGPAPPAHVAAPESLADVPADRWTELLSGVDVELSAELGRADLPLGEITRLDGDSVLTLDHMVNEPVTVYVNGTPYATARLVVVDGEYGIEIIEVTNQGGLAATLAA
jgi:flagellar motor switch protein FliN/FliY